MAWCSNTIKTVTIASGNQMFNYVLQCMFMLHQKCLIAFDWEYKYDSVCLCCIKNV